MCLKKKELFRVRLANEMKKVALLSDQFKLVYYEGGNLVLLRFSGRRWIVEKQTGPWFDENEEGVYFH